jgi:hypothetical protein
MHVLRNLARSAHNTHFHAGDSVRAGRIESAATWMLD